MKQIKQFTLLLVFLVSGKLIKAQEPTSGNFSLQQAIEYAMKNSPNAVNAQNEIIAAKYRKREIAGIGYPQLNASFDLKNFIKIPVQVIPNFVAPAVYAGLVAANAAPYDEQRLSADFYDPIAAQFGQKYQAGASASLSQIIFSSDYVVALQAAKYLERISTLNADRTKADVVSGVSAAYYSVLVNSARMQVLTSNIDRLANSLKELKAYNEQGFVEIIDVERLEVTYNNLLTEKQNIERFMTLSDAALRFQMGYVNDGALTLTDSLPSSVNENEISISKADPSNRSEYQLLKSSFELNQLNLKKEKLGYLPSLVGYASGGYNAFRSEFDIFKTGGNWYPSLILGATLNISIFDGLQRHNRIQQVKLQISSSQQNLKLLEQSVNLQTNSAIVAYNNSIASLKNQTRNKELAKHVQEVAQKKYKEGVGSNLEVVTAEASLRETEANYYNAVYNMLIAKIDYQKATGTLVK